MSETVTILPIEIPAAGETVAVAPGVFWVRMPLPFQLDHINLWLIDDGDGWTMVDTGVLGGETKQLWRRILDRHLGGKPLHRIVCTHCHPDHMGLAGWIAETWGAELWATEDEWATGRRFSLESADPELYKAHYRKAGVSDAEAAPALEHIGSARDHYAEVPARYRRLRDGEVFRMAGHDWIVMVALGHSIEHACLYCPDLDLMIAGDQFLPKITPALVVSVSAPDESPLRLFLDSNRRFLDLPERIRVLPSHNLPFSGLQARIGQYEAHHAKRLDMTLDACTSPASCVDVARKIFSRPIAGRSMFFAIGETLSHLRYLIDDGAIQAGLESDGIIRYSRG